VTTWEISFAQSKDAEQSSLEQSQEKAGICTRSHADFDSQRFLRSTGRYSPGPIVEVISKVRQGDPDPRHMSTSFVERQNLTMRMAIRRMTRLTNAFSKKLDNLKAACALHFAYYNFCRIHQTLRVTPAMEAGLADHAWKLEELLCS